jgi:hypothetical protein
MQNPANAGSMYLSYKGTFRIVSLAIGDANYCFTFAYAGCQGRISDGGVFRETTFYTKMEIYPILDLYQDKWSSHISFWEMMLLPSRKI